MFTKFRKIHKKTSEMECLFNEKIDSIDRSLPINFGKIFRTVKRLNIRSNVFNDNNINIQSDTFIVNFEQIWYNPAGSYMFKVNNRNTRTRCEVCSKLTIKTPERRHWCLYCLTLNIFHTLLQCFS